MASQPLHTELSLNLFLRIQNQICRTVDDFSENAKMTVNSALIFIAS